MIGSEQLAQLPDPFPVLRCRLTFEAKRPILWPDYEGSTLRGIFGQSLRKVACVTGMDNCRGCPMVSRCGYKALFEPDFALNPLRSSQHVAPAYVLKPAPQSPRELGIGEIYSFDFILLNSAREWLATALIAWRRALSESIGPCDGTAVLTDASLVTDSGHLLPLLDRTGLKSVAPEQLAESHIGLAEEYQFPSAVTVAWQTPVRLKRAGQLLNHNELEASDFLLAVARRITEVSSLHMQKEIAIDYRRARELATAVRCTSRELNWIPLLRWSNRQQRKMPLSGVGGSITLQGDIAPFWLMLRVGEVLHVGGKTSFGLGCYRLILGDSGSARQAKHQFAATTRHTDHPTH